MVYYFKVLNDVSQNLASLCLLHYPAIKRLPAGEQGHGFDPPQAVSFFFSSAAFIIMEIGDR